MRLTPNEKKILEKVCECCDKIDVIEALIANSPSPASIVDNGDGTFTFSNGISAPVIIDYSSSITDNGDSTFTIENPDGTSATISVTTIVDNGNGTATITSGADSATVVTNPTTGQDNGDGTITIQLTDGTPLIIDICKLMDDMYGGTSIDCSQLQTN